MKLHFCGGSSEVGASCILIELNNRRILLDCGMRMKGDRMPDLGLIQQAGGIDGIILSHAHMDHTGILPVISTEFPDAAIHCTPPTANLVRVLLGDSIKIMKLSQEEEIPLYDRKQVDATLDRIARHPFSQPFYLDKEQEIQVTLFPAGHILGAASVYLSSKDGSLFYSGDISADRQRTIPKALVPRLSPDICIFESTYGNRLHSDRSAEETRFITQVTEVIANGGKVLIPAFAVGRAQEVILILRNAINTGLLPGCKVYVDGMVREVCRIYKDSPNYLSASLAKSVWKGHNPFFSDTVLPVENQEQRENIIKDNQPCCIVASSGMLAGGASAFYAEHLAGDDKAYITITGYQDEESPGAKLQSLFSSKDAEKQERSLTVNGRNISVKCGLGTFGLSAHADKTQLCGFIKQLSAKRVFLVHGDKTAISSLQTALEDGDFRGRVTVPGNGSSFMVDCRPGQKFRVRSLPFELNKEELPDDSGLKMLSEKLRENPEFGQISWSATELCRMWGGNGASNEDQFMELLNRSIHFECNPRRLYLFQAVAPDENALGSYQQMEVNAMLTLLKESFPSEVMYKSGARLESHKARIFFRFPDVAKNRYVDALNEFQRRSGWSVEINQYPDTSSFLPLLHEIIGKESDKIKKISWNTDAKSVTLSLSAPLDSPVAAAEAFKSETGYALLLPDSGTDAVGSSITQPDLAFSPKCTQQEAMQEIDDIFKPEEITIFKKSIRSTGDSKCIELQFLTPVIGGRYEQWLKGIYELTGWPVTVAQNPRQQELIMLAQSCANAHGLSISKGPSIRQSEQSVEITVSDNTKTGYIEKAQQEFSEKSGYQLCVV